MSKILQRKFLTHVLQKKQLRDLSPSQILDAHDSTTPDKLRTKSSNDTAEIFSPFQPSSVAVSAVPHRRRIQRWHG